jgi:ankyrin repeat protein
MGTPSERLAAAARRGDVPAMEAASGAGADVNAFEGGYGGEHGRTPLMEAAAGGSVAAIDVLLRAGARPRATDGLGSTAVIAAASANRADAIAALVAGGASVNQADHCNCTPLHAAAVKGAVDAVRALVALGADKHVRTTGGYYAANAPPTW